MLPLAHSATIVFTATNLADTTPGEDLWPGLSSDGFYDAMALFAGPSMANPFTLTFVWLGAGLPGSQVFTIYDAGFSTLVKGMTVPPPPSPPELSFLPVSADNKLQLAWSPASAVLEQSSDLVTWTPVPGAVTPFTVAPGAGPGGCFFRLNTDP